MSRAAVQSHKEKARKELARRELARQRLVDFACYVDPGAAKPEAADTFLENWYRADHLQLLAEKLEAVERGEIKRLMVFMPNRHWKSSLATQKFPAWFIGKRYTEEKPHQVIIASYGATLAEELSSTSRDMVKEGERYRNVFPTVRIARNKQSASSWGLMRYDSDEDEPYPSCVAAGVGGGITGKGADLLVIDDPVKDAVEAESPSTQELHWKWWTTTARTRLNPGGAVVLIMTRWAQKDMAGKLLAKADEDPMADQWEVLVLPALAYTEAERTEAKRLGIPVADEDPLGREAGQALWPARYPEEVHLGTKAVDLFAFNSIGQQMPRKPGGFLMGRNDFKMLALEPEKNVVWALATDVAITEKEVSPRGNRDPDWTVAFKVGLWTPKGDEHDARIVLARMWRKQTDYPRTFLKGVLKEVGPDVPVYGAQDNIDKVIFNDLRAEADLINHTIVTLPRIKGDKLVRSAPWRNRVETGRVYVVEGSWNGVFFDEAEGFPKAGHDDQIDAISVGVYALGIRQADGVNYLPNLWDLDRATLKQRQEVASA